MINTSSLSPMATVTAQKMIVKQVRTVMLEGQESSMNLENVD